MSAPATASASATPAAPSTSAAAAPIPTPAPRDVRSLLQQDESLRIPHYHNLEWRLDLVVASRMARRTMQPTLLVEIETRPSGVTYNTSNDEDEEGSDDGTTAASSKADLLASLNASSSSGARFHQLQLDYANLDHLVSSLESALKASTSSHARRVMRYVK